MFQVITQFSSTTVLQLVKQTACIAIFGQHLRNWVNHKLCNWVNHGYDSATV